ncbi:response regulator transcription factor [Clostridium grantii]|uniref:Stage 0 sporulation protein A homolog n=1 Tax=Clostridium grantii DSM 8605 TaxID=1121316 RepID=A0A1M5X040_9CLOT|nr:response regulator [Clostridium grantii]SHH92982.1 two-component system, response regulator YesN [Clostridium grantii DSM 8605]
MYKVLIVDDELPARELLKMKIDWKSIGFQITGMAKNGKEALEFYNSYKPDLVITDIEMPVMDGLSLIQSIKEINESQPIIILSCHESFSYARKAIKLGVNDYLIKDSIETEELRTIITHMFKKQETNKKKLSSQSETISQKKKSVVTRHLIKYVMNDSKQQEYISQYELHLYGNQFKLLFIDIEILDQDLSKPQSQFFNNDAIESLQYLIRLSLNDYALGEICHDEGNCFIVVYGVTKSHSQMDSQGEALEICASIRNNINSKFNTQTTIGVSSPFSKLINLNTAYNESKQCVNRKIISGYDKTYLFSNVSSIDKDQYIKILNVKLNRINDYLNNYNFKPIFKEIDDIFLQNLKGFMQYNYLKHTNWTLLSMLIEFCSKNNLSFIELSGSHSPWETIMDMKTVDGMCTWFNRNIEIISDLLCSKVDNNYSYHVQKSINYIHKHYSQNISLNDLSEMDNLNSSYLSRIFKKETGTSITDYINKVRTEEAKSLIQNSNKKMYEIAELTGFSSTQRFFLIFKKVVGSSPGDFRKN